MCNCVPTATVWRWPEATGALSASSTVSVTSPPRRMASQTLTLRGATFRRIGPASTRGLLLSELLSDSQGMIKPRVGDELAPPDRPPGASYGPKQRRSYSNSPHPVRKYSAQNLQHTV